MHMGRRNIVLMGFMGTGKTTVGRMLAAKLGLRFVDMDAIIEERQGKPISRIFAEEGEPHFRALERALVQELSAQDGLVVATGGGVVLNRQNIDDYSRTGLVVCLSAAPGTILARVAQETHRPLLEGDEKARRIVTLLESRRALYASIPHQIDTNALTAEQVTAAIVKLYAA